MSRVLHNQESYNYQVKNKETKQATNHFNARVGSRVWLDFAVRCRDEGRNENKRNSDCDSGYLETATTIK